MTLIADTIVWVRFGSFFRSFFFVLFPALPDRFWDGFGRLKPFPKSIFWGSFSDVFFIVFCIDFWLIFLIVFSVFLLFFCMCSFVFFVFYVL